MTSSSPVTAQLILIQGDTQHFQQVIELHNTNQTIGRAQTSDITWSSLQVSRKHAVLEYNAPRWFIRDTSTNGLTVNNDKLEKNQPYLLSDADIISFIPTGTVRYRFRYVTHLTNRAAARPPPTSSMISPLVTFPPVNLPSSAGQRHTEARSRASIEEVIVEDSHSDSEESNRSLSLLSVDPPEDFYSFSGDERPHSPSLFEGVLSKRKHHSDSSDGESKSTERKKKKVQVLHLSDETSSSSSEDNSRPGFASSSASAQIPSTSSDCNSKSFGFANKMMTDVEINKCDDINALKEHLRSCVTRLAKTEVDLKAMKCERDMEREEFRRKEKDVESVNEAFKEEMYKKVIELMESEFSCSVCNEVFINATVIDCGHTFCSFCINEWARKKLECPICRKNFRNRSRHIEMENFVTRVYETMSSEIATRRKNSIKERQEQTKKAAADAQAAEQAAQGARHGNVHNLMQAGRYIDFLAELHQINEILVPRGGRNAERRRSARIQDRVVDPNATGAGVAPTGRGRRRGGRREAIAPPPVQPPTAPRPAAAPRMRLAGAPPRGNVNAAIPVVTINDTQNDDVMLGFPNQFLNYVPMQLPMMLPDSAIPIPELRDQNNRRVFHQHQLN